MNLKILSTNLAFAGQIDDFESFFTVLVHGDRSMAKVVLQAGKNNTEYLAKGNYIYAEDSPEYLFIITDVQKKYDQNGCTMEVTAYDIFWILEGRITSAATTGISNTGKSVEYTIKDWLDKCLVNPTDTNRAVVGVSVAANQDRGSTVNTVVYHTPLADNIKQLLAIDGLGLRGGYNSTTKKFVVDVYEGADRSVGNSEGNPPVIFDIKYDNIQGGEEKDSNAAVKNAAYVFCNRDGSRVMVDKYPASGEPTGALRREFAVATTDSLTDSDMEALGLSGLVSEENSVTVNHTALVGSFVYGVDYFLGDWVTVAGKRLRLVEVARAWEGTNPAKIDLTFGQKVVTEQTQTSANTSSIQALEVQVLGVGFGDALGPDGATEGNFPAFADATGKVLEDSGYSPADFADADHGHDVIASKGLQSAETGRTVIDTGIYTYNVNNASLGGSTPTGYWSVLGFGRGTSGMAEIAINWTSSGLECWFRSLRDTTNDWWPWKELWHTGNDGSGSGLDADKVDGQHISIRTGQCTLNDDSATSVTFSSALPRTPRIALVANTTNSGVITGKVGNVSTTGFQGIIGGTGTTSVFDYVAIYVA